MLETSTILITILLTVVVFLAVFLAIRTLNIWYWKIDERIGLLKNIADCQLIHAEQSVKQTHILNILAAHQLKDSKIGLTNKTTGQYQVVTYSELLQYNLKEYDVAIIN